MASVGVTAGLYSAGSVIVVYGAQLLHSLWGLPRPGIEHVSLALIGRWILTTEPGGKPTQVCLNTKSIIFHYSSILSAWNGAWHVLN